MLASLTRWSCGERKSIMACRVLKCNPTEQQLASKCWWFWKWQVTCAAACAQAAEPEAAHFMSDKDEAFMEQRSATRIIRSRLRPSSLGLRLR